ncbi:MAG: GH39 family glycosyl hydrolase [Candidatus Rokuibacteriota bacterium]
MGRPRFSCTLSSPAAPLPHVWEHTVGSDHAPVALRADWQAQLRRCRREVGFRHVRLHGLLSDDVGTVVRHQRRLLYSFFNADQIVDFLLGIGMRPFVELSFMPNALASGTKTVFHYRGNVTPPRDYREWAELIRRLVAHWVDRYGASEVRRWFFEVWNEPNLKDFWTGSRMEYWRLYRHAAEAIKGVDPSLRVGGPATAKNAWISEFLEYCDANGVPVDFVSTHHYPTDALGHEGHDTETQLARSRRSLLRDQARETRDRARGRPVYYTEWNTSSNPRDSRHDEPYAAAFIVKTVMEASGLVKGYSFWTFSDLFEENYFPSVPFHGGFGLLTLHGIAKPAYRAFQLLHCLGTERLPVDGRHETVDIWAVRKKDQLALVLTNHALPRHSIDGHRVLVRLADTPPPRAAVVERIDDGHANVKAEWRRMGEPEYLDRAAVERLHEASRTVAEPCPVVHAGRTLDLEIDLPPHGVAVVTIDLAPGEPQARRGR